MGRTPMNGDVGARWRGSDASHVDAGSGPQGDHRSHRRARKKGWPTRSTLSSSARSTVVEGQQVIDLRDHDATKVVEESASPGHAGAGTVVSGRGGTRLINLSSRSGGAHARPVFVDLTGRRRRPVVIVLRIGIASAAAFLVAIGFVIAGPSGPATDDNKQSPAVGATVKPVVQHPKTTVPR